MEDIEEENIEAENTPEESFEEEGIIFGEDDENKDGIVTMDDLDDVPLRITVQLGQCNLKMEEILKLDIGSIIGIDKLAGEPLEFFFWASPTRSILAHPKSTCAQPGGCESGTKTSRDFCLKARTASLTAVYPPS